MRNATSERDHHHAGRAVGAPPRVVASGVDSREPADPRRRRPAPPSASRGARSPATPLAAARQPVPAARDPVRRPGRGDPPRVAPDPGRDRRRGPRRSGARRLRRRRRDRRPSTRNVRLDPAQVEALVATAPSEFTSMPGTPSGTSCSAARTSSSGPSAARPSSATSTAAGAPATSPTSSTTSGSSARSTSSTRRVAARSSPTTCRSRPATSTCTGRSPSSSTRPGSASASGRARSTTRSRSSA